MTLPTSLVELRVYDRDGVTLRSVIRHEGVTWTDEWKDFGTASMTAKLLQDALAADPLLLRRALVKVAVPLTSDPTVLTEIFAFLTAPGRGTIVGPGEDADKDWSPACVGALGLLDAWRVYPELGLTQRGGETRAFGWMSSFFDDSAWSAPNSTRGPWGDLNETRAGYPGDWPDPGAYWLGTTFGRVKLLRTQFTLAADTLVRIYMSADETFRTWLDAAEVPELADQHDEIGYTAMSTYEVTLAAGAHTLATYMTTIATPGIGDGYDGLLCCVAALGSTGEPTTIIRRSDLTNWKAYSLADDTVTRPGLTGAAIMLRLLDEADARGVQAAGWLTPTFTATHDTNAVAFTDAQEREWEVGTQGGDVARDLTELAPIFEVGPDMTLNAYATQGTDRTATVFLNLGGPDANLDALSFDGEPMTGSTLMGLTAEGWFEQSAVGAEERVEAWLENGLSLSIAQGTQLADAVLPDLARERFTFTATVTAHDDFVPYVHFFKGDTITGIGVDGQPLAVTIVSISGIPVSKDGIVSWALELEEAA